MECFENPEEACASLGGSVMEYARLVDIVKDPETLEMIKRKKGQTEEKWRRSIELRRAYERQVLEARKTMLKFLVREEHNSFIEWVENPESDA